MFISIACILQLFSKIKLTFVYLNTIKYFEHLRDDCLLEEETQDDNSRDHLILYREASYAFIDTPEYEGGDAEEYWE